MFERRKFETPWEGAMEPFRIVGNVYFVGTFQASSHLIDTGDGLILIDTGYANTLYLLMDSIHRLGFDPKNIRYIINTHWHGDHTEGSLPLAQFCGAKNLLGKEDRERCKEKHFDPDQLLSDGDTLTLGNTTITFLETPGHTAGTISLFFETEEDGKIYRCGMFGGAGANTMAKNRWEFEGCQEAYRNSLHRLQKEKVDVFLGNHTWNNNTFYSGKKLLEEGINDFIDPALWGKFLSFCEERLDRVIAKEKAEGLY